MYRLALLFTLLTIILASRSQAVPADRATQGVTSYAATVDLASCGRDRVADPERYNVRLEIRSTELQVSAPTAVRKIHYECERDICSESETYEYDQCESEIRITGLDLKFEALVGNQLRSRVSSAGSLIVRSSQPLNNNGICPASLDFSGQIQFYELAGLPRLEIVRGNNRVLSVAPHSGAWASGELVRRQGNQYTLNGFTLSQEKSFQWQHNSEPYNVRHYCSGTAATDSIW